MKYKRLYNEETKKFELFYTNENAVSDEEIRMGVPVILKQLDLEELLQIVNDRVTLNIEKSQSFPNATLMSEIIRIAFLKLYQNETFIEE